MLCGLALAFPACSTEQYGYAPIAQHPNSIGAHGEAFYPVPGQAGSNIRIRSMGLVRIEPKEGAPEISAVHIRVSLSNQSDRQTWIFDVEKQYVSFPNTKPVFAAFANSDSDHLPKLEIPPKHLRIVDLYFSPPKAEAEAKDIPEFDFSWKFMAGNTALKDTTPFNRIPIPQEPLVLYPYATYAYPLGWGPYWWVWGWR